jgi:predicted nucleic acid-binding protein
MSKIYLLDTSALIAHHRRETGWNRIQSLLEDQEALFLLAAPSLTEFSRKLHDLGATEEDAARRALSYRELFSEVVPIDGDIAMKAFALQCGTPGRLPLVDALIAAAAAARDATFVHRDAHFGAIPEKMLRQEILG